MMECLKNILLKCYIRMVRQVRQDVSSAYQVRSKRFGQLALFCAWSEIIQLGFITALFIFAVL
jgi:hypothetical protein